MAHEAPHIQTAFDRDLEALQALIMKMGGLVESAMAGAARALEARDEELAAQVRAADTQVDLLERQIHQDCARIIALRGPTATDLRTVLSVMKTAGDLERIGDYAKNIAKRVAVLAQMPQVGNSAGTLRRMMRAVELMLKDALDAFTRRDVELARHVRASDEEVDQIYNTLFRAFLTHMMEDPRAITAFMHLHFIAKNIERMGDHVTNIAEQVIYLATGTLPDDPRPKADATPFAPADE
ncbi:MAG: phosphate signaling complex protein PhoU [Rhodobacteraceae bacterium]|jgi:phosphate transport system protein|nr:phosphate signaling complex protein PhoU [Paracoccaceae bacterium]